MFRLKEISRIVLKLRHFSVSITQKMCPEFIGLKDFMCRRQNRRQNENVRPQPQYKSFSSKLIQMFSNFTIYVKQGSNYQVLFSSD